MKPLAILTLAVALIYLLAGDKITLTKTADREPDSKQKREIQKSETLETTLDFLQSPPKSGSDEIKTITERIYDLEDTQLVPYLSSLLSDTTAEKAADLFPIIYEETQLRPPHIRLPLLLEIARHPHGKADLRNTIMANLGTVLKADHGSSWADWSLALHEHLSDQHGLIMAE